MQAFLFSTEVSPLCQNIAYISRKGMGDRVSRPVLNGIDVMLLKLSHIRYILHTCKVTNRSLDSGFKNQKYCRVPPPYGSKLRWREEMGGGLPNAWGHYIQIAIKLPLIVQHTLPIIVIAHPTDYLFKYEINERVDRDNILTMHHMNRHRMAQIQARNPQSCPKCFKIRPRTSEMGPNPTKQAQNGQNPDPVVPTRPRVPLIQARNQAWALGNRPKSRP